MMLCKVTGTIVSTQKHPSLKDKKLLLIQQLNLDGDLSGKDILAVDSVDAGVGDIVLAVQEGAAAQQVLGRKDAPVHTVIVAVVDGYSLEEM